MTAQCMNSGCVAAIYDVLSLFDGEIVMNKEAEERVEMIIRNIVNAARGTPMPALDEMRRAIAAVIGTYESEAHTLREQRDVALKDAESKRFALESIASNVYSHNIVNVIKNAMKSGLPGRNFD